MKSEKQTGFPDWLDRNAYPFESRYFNQPAGRMHYIDEGTGDPLVMVHGNPGWSFEFRHLVKSLSGHYRCIAPDHIGFGLSDKPADWTYLPEQQAENFARLMEGLRLDKVTLLVNDWGGPIALSWALRHPEKVKRIVLLNSWMWPVNDDPHFRKFSSMMGGAAGRFLIRYFNIFARFVVKKAVGDKTKLPQAVHRQYIRHLSKPSERKGSYVFPRHIVASGEWLGTLWERRERIAQLPVIIVWGMKDIAFREKELLRWQSLWPEAKLLRLGKVGHYPQEEAPETLIAELLSVAG